MVEWWGVIEKVISLIILHMWRTQIKNHSRGEKSFSAETLVFCRARQGESIPPLSVVIREDGHVW